MGQEDAAPLLTNAIPAVKKNQRKLARQKTTPARLDLKSFCKLLECLQISAIGSKFEDISLLV
jgi:hypothetical protein